MAHFVVEYDSTKYQVFSTISKAEHFARSVSGSVRQPAAKPNPYEAARQQIRKQLAHINGRELTAVAKAYGVKCNVKHDLLRTGIEQAHMALVSAKLREGANA